ncbi:MAG: TRAP transporter large permease [Rhodobacteraceae bacterium]|nr:TRAP transporter large permease [Paracoccaceae bacterium]
MMNVTIGFIGLGGLVVLLFLRMHVGLALALVSFLGLTAIRGFDSAYGALRNLPYDFAASWGLTAIPMFLLMGAIAYHGGLTSGLFRAAKAWLGQLPGGLAVASTMACAMFAAVSGSSLATASAMGRIAIPEMLQARYDAGLAAGSVAAAGTIGSLIPPSILMILYAVFTEQSISMCLMAGILPGLLTAFMYSAMIVLRCSFNDQLAPAVDASSWKERFASGKEVWPVVAVAVGVVVTIYAGLATEGEAAGIGAALMAIVAFVHLRRGSRKKAFMDAARETVLSTSSILLIAIGASLLTRFVVVSGIPRFISSQIIAMDLSTTMVLFAIAVFTIILGMFLDPMGVLLITLPIALPLIEAANIDLIWFAVIMIKLIEIGLITPPIGMNVFVIKGVVGNSIPLSTIFRGIGWFVAVEILTLIILILFPQISLFIPNLMVN